MQEGELRVDEELEDMISIPDDQPQTAKGVRFDDTPTVRTMPHRSSEAEAYKLQVEVPDLIYAQGETREMLEEILLKACKLPVAGRK